MDELDVDSIFKFKVDELKQELAKRGLAKSGSKSDLQERLLQYVTSKLYTNEDSSVADVDGKLEASLEEDLEEGLDASDPVEESVSKPDTSVEDDSNDVSGTNVLNDEFISIDELPNEDGVASNTSNTSNNEEYEVVDQTDKDTSVGEAVVSEEQSDVVADTKDKSEEPKFCRVTITSPENSERVKKDSRSKRFGDSLSSEDGETDKKKARLGRFSSMGMGKGETVTEEDMEKIKKRAERFGAVSSILNSPSGDSTKDRLQSRKDRFADTNLKKRQERFAVTNTKSLDITTKSLDITSDMEVRKQNRVEKFGALS